MRRSGVGSGGGFGSNKHVDSRNPKVEPKSYARNPAAVSQYGEMVGNHITSTVNTTYSGERDTMKRGYEPPGMISDPVKAVGVGGGRTIYKTGSQCQTGAPDRGSPRPAGRGILNNE